MSTQSKGTALITGASTGIGAIYADRLARRGYDLILVARNRERLDQLANRLTSQTRRSIEVLTADLSDKEDLSKVEEKLRTDASITMLVNNAGIGSLGPILATKADEAQSMIELNVTALTRLTHATVPGFVARGRGDIINIASIVAVAPEILNGVYGGTKAFVLAFSQSLRHELADKGVRVQVVLPGAIATEFWALGGRPVDQLPQQIVMSGEDLVDAALAGFDQGEFVTVPSLPNKADWDAFEAARRTLGPNLSHSRPAQRYGVPERAA
jgi:short-subunit dehydrogenase